MLQTNRIKYWHILRLPQKNFLISPGTEKYKSKHYTL
jgi:hypothetical protein